MEKKQLTHGGDWAGFEIEYGRQPLDFSMNVNPLGISKAMQEAIAKAAASAERYPDPLCRELTQRLAEAEGVPAERIFCGNGAADIIFRLAHALKAGGDMLLRQEPPEAHESGAAKSVLLVTAPTFSEYETAFAENGWQICRYLLKEEQGFRIGEDILDAIGEDTDAVFLCEPNNPTGITTDHQILHKILKHCRQTDTVLVIDECFYPLTGAGISGRGLNDNALHLRAFTKTFAIPGIRLGYVISRDREMLTAIRKHLPEWNVSRIAERTGEAASDVIRKTGYLEESVRMIDRERGYLAGQLEKLGIRVYGSDTNYILIRSVSDLYERLLERGVLIRRCANFSGLDETYFRIAVRKHEENEELIKIIGEVI